MNARGKPLTRFENFKARLQLFLDAVEGIDRKAIMEKIDTSWSDFFWKYQKQSYDESFLQFLYALLYNQLARNNQNRERLFTAINQGEIIRLDELATVQLGRESWINDIEVALDALCAGQLLEQSSVLGTADIIAKATKNDMDYTDRVQLYAVVSYIRAYGADFSVYDRWMRFIRNVTMNTIYNRVEDYMQSIQAINSLIGQAHQLDAYLADPMVRLTGFFGSQLLQEQLKARLIQQDVTWRECLYTAEDHEYFAGEIGFLLQFIDAQEHADWSHQDHHEKQAKFLAYYEKAKAIFGKTTLNVPINLLSRALLTFGNYLIQSGQNYSFLIEGFDRDISWKRYLRHQHIVYFKELLDQITPQSILVDLQRIIDNSGITDWRKHFIQYPLILEKTCGKRRLIRYYDETEILLLDTTMTSGYCQEYYSYAIYAALLQNGIACNYCHSIGAYNEKYVELTNTDFSLNFVDKQFYIYDQDAIIAELANFDEAVEKMIELAS